MIQNEVLGHLAKMIWCETIEEVKNSGVLSIINSFLWCSDIIITEPSRSVSFILTLP